MRADQITVQKGMECSPYFITTGAHPTLPLDIVEATWLVELPDGPLSTEELIGYRAQALAKHAVHVDAMCKRVTQQKIDAVLCYEKEHKNKIKDFVFKPKDLVLIHNMAVENSLDKKMKPQYLGPIMVVVQNRGSAYIVAELNDSVWQEKVGAFRIIPYHARRRMELPQDLLNFIDISRETLAELRESTDTPKSVDDIWFDQVDVTRDNADAFDTKVADDSGQEEDEGFNDDEGNNDEEPVIQKISRLKTKGMNQ